MSVVLRDLSLMASSEPSELGLDDVVLVYLYGMYKAFW